MELSVIIPCLNAGATLATQLDALSAQRWSKPWEVLVCDNGSTDNSLSIVQEYANRLPGLRVINASARKGSGHARNVGVRAAKGKAVAFCDADDEVAPRWVEEMGEALLQYDAVAGQLCFDRFNDAEHAASHARQWQNGFYRAQFLPHGATSNLGVRIALHEAIGGFDEALLLFQDGDYCWRMLLMGYQIHYLPAALVQYRIGRMNTALSYLYRRGRLSVAADYWLFKKYGFLGIARNRVIASDCTLQRSFMAWLRHLKGLLYGCMRDRDTAAARLRDFVGETGKVTGHCQGLLTNPCRRSSKAMRQVINPEVCRQIISGGLSGVGPGRS